MWKCTYSQCSLILGNDLLSLKVSGFHSPVILTRAVIMKMTMKQWSNDIDRGKNKQLGKKTAPAPL